MTSIFTSAFYLKLNCNQSVINKLTNKDFYIDNNIKNIVQEIELAKLIDLNIEKYGVCLSLSVLGLSINEINQIFIHLMTSLFSISSF